MLTLGKTGNEYRKHDKSIAMITIGASPTRDNWERCVLKQDKKKSKENTQSQRPQ